MVGITPQEFWTLSPIEVYMTIDGFVEFNGGNQTSESMDSDRLQELMELYPD